MAQTSPETAPLPDRLLRNTSFQLMWSSAAASGFGDRIVMLVALALLGAWGANQDAAASTAAIYAAFFLPYLIVAPLGGWLSDRLPRKWILLSCDEFRAIVLLFAFMLIPPDMSQSALPLVEQWKVFALLIGIGCCAATFFPARAAIMPEIMPDRHLQAGNAVVMTITLIAASLGMVIGDKFILPDQPDTLRRGLFIALSLYAATGLFFAFVRPRPSHSITHPHAAPSALPWILGKKRILVIIALNLLIWLAATVLQSTIPTIGKIHFDLTDKALQSFAMIQGALLGVGMLLGAIVASTIPSRHHAPMFVAGPLVPAGLGMLLVTIAPFSWMVSVGALMTGIFGCMSIIGCLTLLQSFSPDHLRGRVLGISATIENIGMVGCSAAIGMPVILRVAAAQGLALEQNILPSADSWIIPLARISGSLLILVGGIATLVYVLRRPHTHSRMANVFWHGFGLFSRWWHRMSVQGKHNIPRSGPVLLAINHPSMMDPFFVQVSISRMARWIMVDSYHYKWLTPMWNACRPVVISESAGNKEALRNVVDALSDGDIVGIFPEGRLWRDVKDMRPLRPGILMMARRSGAPIVPIWVERTHAGNAMLSHFFKPARAKVSIGEPWMPDFDKTSNELLAELDQRIRALKN